MPPERKRRLCGRHSSASDTAMLVLRMTSSTDECPRIRAVGLLGMEWFTQHPGGLNRYVRDLRNALEGAAVSARTVVLGAGPEGLKGVQSAGRVTSPIGIRLLRYWRAAQHLGSRVDVLDAHFALYALLPIRVGALRGVPLVVHFHGPWADESADSHGRLDVGLRRLVETLVYRRAREVVVLSGAFRQVLVERYRVSPWRVHVLAPGVDFGTFQPGDRAAARAALGIDPGAQVAVAVRRLVPRMGLNLLLEAWAEVTVNNPGCLLLLVGDGPGRAELSNRARHLGMGERVRFLGQVSDELLRTCYQAAHLSVVPSVALEGFGLVVPESLASGTPPVVTDVGGLPEAVAGLDPSLIVPAWTGKPSLGGWIQPSMALLRCLTRPRVGGMRRSFLGGRWPRPTCVSMKGPPRSLLATGCGWCTSTTAPGYRAASWPSSASSLLCLRSIPM